MYKIALVVLILLSSFSLKAIDNVFVQNEKLLSESLKLDFEYSFIEGVKCRVLGDYKMAIKWFSRCLSIDKTSSAVRYELANIYIAANDNDSAMNLLREALKYNSKNVWYKLQLANVYRNKAMIDKACDIYESLYREYPKSLDYLFVQASLYTSVEDWSTAVKMYDRIESLQGINENTSLEKYKLYSLLKKNDKADKEIVSLINAFPDKSEYLAILADSYILSKKDEKALELFNKMLKINPENGYVYFYIADYYKNINDIESFKKNISIGITKDNVDVSYKIQFIIQLYLNLNSFDIGQTFLDSLVNKLLELYPDDYTVIALQVDILKSYGNLQEARELLLKLISMEKHFYPAWESLLILDNQLNDSKLMMIHSLEALKYFPDKPMIYILNGISYLIENNNEKALGIFSLGVDLVDNNNLLLSQFYYYQAECLYNLNKKDDAFVMFDKVLNIDSLNVNVLNNYSYYLALANKDLEKAEKMISKCIELEGDNPTYMDTYAWVLFKRKRFSEALFFMNRVIALDKENSPILMEHLGDILFMNNKIIEAKDAWKKAIDFGGDSILLKRKILEEKLIE